MTAADRAGANKAAADKVAAAKEAATAEGEATEEAATEKAKRRHPVSREGISRGGGTEGGSEANDRCRDLQLVCGGVWGEGGWIRMDVKVHGEIMVRGSRGGKRFCIGLWVRVVSHWDTQCC